MATLRLIKDQEPSVSTPPAEAAASAHGEADGPVRRTVETRIKLESLPVPLRATVRDREGDRLTLEAELPWLGIGTVLHAGEPDQDEYTGRVQSFDIEVTSTGTARLLIHAAPGVPGAPPRRRRGSRWRPWLIAATLGMTIAGAALGYVAATWWEQLELPAPAAPASPPR